MQTCAHHAPRTVRELICVDTTWCQHYLVPTLLSANTTWCQHYVVPTLRHANTTQCIDMCRDMRTDMYRRYGINIGMRMRTCTCIDIYMARGYLYGYVVRYVYRHVDMRTECVQTCILTRAWTWVQVCVDIGQ